MWTYCAKCKQEEILSTKKKKVKKEKRKKGNTKWRKKTKSWLRGGEWLFCPTRIFPFFFSHFLHILWKLNFDGSEKKTVRPQFSLLTPLPTKPHFHPFSLLFSTLFFSPFSLKSTQPKLKEFTLKFSTHKIVF